MQKPMRNKREKAIDYDRRIFSIKGNLSKAFIVSIKSFWSNISFRKKTILYTAIILYFFILVFGMLIYNRAVGGMNQIEQENTRRRLTFLDEEVKSLFSNYTLVTNTLLLDTNFQEKLQECPTTLIERREYDNEISQYLAALCNSVKNAADWDLYFTYDRGLPAKEKIHFVSDVEGEAWFTKLTSKKRNVITWHLEQSTTESDSYFVCGLGVANRKTGYIPAYFKMEIGVSRVVPVIRSAMEQIDAVFLLCSQDGTILWSSDTQDYSDYIPVYEEMSFLNPVSISGNLGQRSVIALDGGKYGYTIICIQNQSNSLTQYLGFGRFFLLVLMLIIVFSFVLLHFSAGLVAGRIKDLTSEVKALDGTHLDYVADVSSQDEVGELSRAFSELVDRIKLLIEHERKNEEERFELEVEALQSQINPHFLYNTLSIINCLACEIEADNISQAIDSLANYYRYALNDGKKMTTLRRELSMLDDYFAICAIRYRNRLQYSKNIDTRALDCRIPKLVLQPFCENALFHGFSGNSEKEPVISISVQMKDDHILVVITDNGDGMSDDELQHAWESGFAITNVHKRIQMLYGEQFGVSITSAPAQGTQVFIKLGFLNDESEEI